MTIFSIVLIIAGLIGVCVMIYRRGIPLSEFLFVLMVLALITFFLAIDPKTVVGWEQQVAGKLK